MISAKLHLRRDILRNRNNQFNKHSLHFLAVLHLYQPQKILLRLQNIDRLSKGIVFQKQENCENRVRKDFKKVDFAFISKVLARIGFKTKQG